MTGRVIQSRASPLTAVKNASSQRSALISAVLSSALMGTLGLFVCESHCSAACCAFARFFLGMILIGTLWAWEIHRRRDFFRVSRYGMAAGAGFGLCILFYFMAIQQMSVAVAALLLYTGPVFAAIGEALIHRQMPPKRDVLLISLSALGVAFVSIFAPDTGRGASQLGLLYGLLSGLCYASYILFNRKIRRRTSIPARTFWLSLAGSAVLLLPMLAGGGVNSAAISSGGIYLLCIGVIQGFAALLPAAYAMKKLSAIKYGTIAYMEPMAAVAIGCIVYHEHISFGQWQGLALIMLASALQSFLPTHLEFHPRRWVGHFLHRH